jgi:hypothetical protein
MGELFQPTHVLILTVITGIILLITGIILLPYWVIFKKAGYSPWLSLLVLIPLINLIVLYVVAFSQWRVVPVGWVPPAGPPPPYPPTFPPQG